MASIRPGFTTAVLRALFPTALFPTALSLAALFPAAPSPATLLPAARLLGAVLIGAVLLAAPASAQQLRGPEAVQVRGEGVVGFTDPARSRGDAIEAAQRDAVEKAVGVMIESETTMQNYALVKDEVLSRSKGFIRTYSVVREGRDRELYKVVIDAVVVKAAFVKDMDAAIENLYQRVGKPRVMVVIKEKYLDKKGRVDQEVSANEKGISEKEIRKILIKRGFTFVDARAAAGMSLMKVALRGEEVARGEAVRAARTAKAEIVILGNASVQDKGVMSNFHIAQADLALDVIRVDSGQVMASEVVSARGLQINSNTARVKALQAAAVDITPRLMEQVTYIWIKDKSQGGRIEIVVRNARFGDLLALKRALNIRVGGIKQLRQRSFRKGVALFELQSRKTTEEIAEGIYLQKFQKFSVEIEDISSKTLTLKLTPNAKPAKKS